MIRLLSVLALAATAMAGAMRVVTTPQGTHLESFAGYAGPVRHSNLDDPQILWSRNLATGIFNSVSIADTQVAFTGSGLNDPREAARYEILGDEIPEFVLEGTEWEVATSQDGLYWAAVDRDVDNNNILYFFSTAVDTPLWINHLGPGYVGGTRCLQFSRDGSTLGLFFGQLNNQQPWIYAWLVADMDSLPVMAYQVETGSGIYARAMMISSDGSVIAATADNFLHMLERDTGLPRDVINVGASTDGLALSADGNWALTGFQAVRCFYWNGTQLVQRWQSSLNSRYNSQLLISPDTTYCVSFWYPLQYNRNHVRVHNLSTGQVLWNYQFRQGTGDYQDWPIDCDISEDSRWFVVGTWGDQGNTNGEAVVFSRYHATPYYELDLPGSCFSLDLSGNGQYLIAAGKHVHANQFGNGGDVSVVDLDLPPAEPLPELPIPELILDSVITWCMDTLRFRIPMYNQGYAPMHIDSLGFTSGFGPRDASFLAYDSTLLVSEIAPGETLWVNITLAPCAHDTTPGWYTHVFRFDVEGLSMGFGLIAQYVPPSASPEPIRMAPATARMHPAYPNPFNPLTTISFDLPSTGPVDMVIYDLAGREVKRWHYESLGAGNHLIEFDASDLPSGIFFASMSAESFNGVQKLVLMK